MAGEAMTFKKELSNAERNKQIREEIWKEFEATSCTY